MIHYYVITSAELVILYFLIRWSMNYTTIIFTFLDGNFVMMILIDLQIIVYSYTLATQNGSMHNGFTNLLTLLPSKQVSFEDDLTDTCVPLEEIPTSTDDKHNTTTEPPSRRTSVVSLDSLLRYKLALCFGICCICVLFLLPIILYYTEGSGDGRTPNTSEVHDYANIMCIYPLSHVRTLHCEKFSLQ